jgi:hypothetical protein
MLGIHFHTFTTEAHLDHQLIHLEAADMGGFLLIARITPHFQTNGQFFAIVRFHHFIPLP